MAQFELGSTQFNFGQQAAETFQNIQTPVQRNTLLDLIRARQQFTPELKRTPELQAAQPTFDISQVSAVEPTQTPAQVQFAENLAPLISPELAAAAEGRNRFLRDLVVREQESDPDTIKAEPIPLIPFNPANRSVQFDQLAQLRQRASGQGPTSGAEQQALDEAAKNARFAKALALSSRDVQGSAALRAAQDTEAFQGIFGEQNRSIVRVAEQQAAQESFADLIQEVRTDTISEVLDFAELNTGISGANLAAQIDQIGLDQNLEQFYISQGFDETVAQVQAQIDETIMLMELIRAGRLAFEDLSVAQKQLVTQLTGAGVQAGGDLLSAAVEVSS